MIKQDKSLRPDTLVLEFEEFVNKFDVALIEREMKKIEEEFGKVNLMIYLHAKGESFGALIKELQLGLKHWNKIGKVAYVSEKKWWKPLIAVDNFFTKFKEKYFDIEEMDEAWKWIGEK